MAGLRQRRYLKSILKCLKIVSDKPPCIDRELLAMLGGTELEEMGIGESHIRKIIMVQSSDI